MTKTTKTTEFNMYGCAILLWPAARAGCFDYYEGWRLCAAPTQTCFSRSLSWGGAGPPRPLHGPARPAERVGLSSAAVGGRGMSSPPSRQCGEALVSILGGCTVSRHFFFILRASFSVRVSQPSTPVDGPARRPEPAPCGRPSVRPRRFLFAEGLQALCVLFSVGVAQRAGRPQLSGFPGPPSPWDGCRPPPPRSRDGGYLVDPASSHMLVSKTKPCMSKYKRFCTVKLRMAH